MIRERNQRLVAASIVPVEPPRGIEERGHYVQQALESSSRGLLISLFVGSTGKERRRRQLAAVAGDDRASATIERGHGIFWKHLARFVEDDNIEVLLIGGEQLADRQRTRHPTRMKRRHHVGRLAEDLSKGEMTTLLRSLTFDERVLLAMRIADTDHVFRVRAVDAADRQL